MDIKQLYIDVQKILKTILGPPNGYIRLADQNAPNKDTGDCAIIVPVSVVSNGSHHRTNIPNGILPPDDFTQKVGSDLNKVTFNVSFYGKDSSKHTTNLVALKSSSQWRRLWHQAGHGFIDIKQIDLPTWLVNEQNYMRSIVTLSFYASHKIDLPINAIDTTTIEIVGELADHVSKTNFKIDNF